MPIRMGAGGHAGKQLLQTMKDLYNVLPHVWQWLLRSMTINLFGNSGKIRSLHGAAPAAIDLKPARTTPTDDFETGGPVRTR